MALKNIKWPQPPNDRSGNGDRPSVDRSTDSSNASSKWRTWLGLPLMYIAVLFDWQWFWGLFTLYWITPSFFTGVTYFIEPITRKDNPLLYWIIMITWVAFSVVMFFPSGT